MAKEKSQTNQMCHVVRFELRDDGSAELIIRVRAKLFSISVDPSDFEDDNGGSHLRKVYDALFRAAQQQIRQRESQESDEADREDARTTNQQEHSDRTSDSGYVSEEREDNTHHKAIELGDPEQELQNWILSPFAGPLAELAPKDDMLEEPTLSEWYNVPVFAFSLLAEKDELKPVRQSAVDTKLLSQSLIPNMSLPKYLRSLSNLPWLAPSDMTVLAESDSPIPVHPTSIRLTKDNKTTTHFLKLVDPSQEVTTKREIRILHQIQRRNLSSHGVRAPKLESLVSSIRHPNSRIQILGFTLTSIPSPTPLTSLIDPSISTTKREAWAAESKHMVQVLHDHGIIWGDAKADNFVVDADDKLWIIDFGGSYTEGWVDPELMETKEGDRMGVEKIEKALRDPVHNTYDPEDEGNGDGLCESSARRETTQKEECDDWTVSRGKRSRGHEEAKTDSDAEDTITTKRRKR